MKKVLLFTLVLAMTPAMDAVKADFTFGTPTVVPNVSSVWGDAHPSISADGRELYFESDRPGGNGDGDIWVATRETIDDDWRTPVWLGTTVNSSSTDWYPSVSADGLSLYFTSRRPSGSGGTDIWVTIRKTTSDPWEPPVNLGSTVNKSGDEWESSISTDGLTLYFTCAWSGGSGTYDLWVTTRETKEAPWAPAENLGPTVNTSSGDAAPSISADGLTLFFCSSRPGGANDFNRYDLYVTRRSDTDAHWRESRKLGPPVNSSFADMCPSVSSDGRTLYFFSNRPGGPGGWDIWQAPILPVVDFNGDGIVDTADMRMIAGHWGEDYPLCDIGPTPLGDGTVDAQDLIVLTDYLTTDINDAATTVGKIIYVDDDAAGTNDGSSWANAYNDLQDALADANSADKPVEIRVAQGIYKPDQGANQTPGDRDATFMLVNDVILKGGFGETNPNVRNIDLYETILSGDLLGNDIDVENPEDLFREPTRFENSRHVLTLPNNFIVATLDGFVVNGGNPHESGPFGTGGGLNTDGGLIGELENADSSITVRNCTFSRNSAAFGGGVYIRGGSPTLINCTFNNNWAGIHISDCNVTLANCTFSGNKGGENAGGVRIHGSNAVLMNCTLTNNSSNELGGGMLIGHSNAILTNCMFMDNSSAFIGGGFLSTHESNSTLVNCTFSGNSASHGGGMYNRYGSSASLINCTFAENLALQGAGFYSDKCCDVYGFWSSASLINCILWGGENEIGCEDESMSGLMITYSNIQGGWPGEGNIDADPLFATPDNGDYHLKSQTGRWDPIGQSWVQDGITSPCIDGGNPMSPIGLEPVPHGGIINMGAYGGAAEASKSAL